MTLEELTARESIRDAIYRYAVSMDRIDHEIGYSVFHPDSVVDYGAVFCGTGKEFIDWVCEFHATKILNTVHNMMNIRIQVNGNEAVSETYMHSVLRLMNDENQLVERLGRGRYFDKWLQRDGEWKIIERKFVKDTNDTRVITIDGGCDSKRNKDDLVYEFFPS